MRKVERIEPFMAEMAKLWKETYLDWRFGQLMFNFFSELGMDPFYLEEDEFLTAFRAYMKGEDPKAALDQIWEVDE